MASLDDQQPATRLDGDSPLKAVAQLWLQKIKAGEKHKRPFTDDANEGMNFFDGPANWMWNARYANDARNGYMDTNAGIAPPTFRMSINRVFEAVKIFGAVMYHRNPTRTVTPVEWMLVDETMLGIPTEVLDAPPEQVDPEQLMQAQQLMQSAFQAFQETQKANHQKSLSARILQAYLNYTPNVLDLKTQSRRVVDEAIIKGMGVWWTQAIEVPGTEGEDGKPQMMIGSFYDSVDNLVVDPDADNMEDIKWCAQRCFHPAHEVAQRYGVPMADLKKNSHTTSTARATNDPYDRAGKNRRPGETNDIVIYWKIWSKTGFGGTLKGFPDAHRGVFDGLGQNCYIVVAEDVPYPLNLPPTAMKSPEPVEGEEPEDPSLEVNPEVMARTQWPIPFWLDSNGWPFVDLSFHRKPGYVYPISHLKPGIGELRFLNWAASWLATRVATSCETMIGVAKAAAEDIKEQLTSHTYNGMKVVELEEAVGKSLNEIISIFQMPEVSPEIWKIIQAVADMFDKRVGLTELAYGMTRASFRSAAEATTKSEQISVRPDDMANTLEDSMGRVARNEAIACRWLLDVEDVEPALGPMAAIAWKLHVGTQDYRQINRSFLYRVESGSSRKPNVASRVEQMQTAVQTLGPILSQLIGAGMPGPFNALVEDWGESLSIDTSRYRIPEPPPQPTQPPPGAVASQAPPPGNAPPPPGPPPSGEPQEATGGGAPLPQVPPELAPQP